jgi:hypothetical protein
MEPAQIAKKVKPFILRRLKADVLKDLPPKIESISYIEMTEKQKTVVLVAAAVDAPGNESDAGRGYAEREPDQNLGGPDAPAPDLLRSGLGHGRLHRRFRANWTG